MKKNRKTLLLASAAIAVMGMGTGSKSALAFDNVSWDWNKLVTENVVKDVNVTIDVSPTGMTEIEKSQTFIGDMISSSTVSNIANNPPSEIVDGTIDVEDFFHITTTTDDSVDPNLLTPAPPVFGSELALKAELLNGTLDEGTDVLDMNVRVFGEIEVGDQLAGELDAVDLPKVESVATAVGNNQDIFSTVSTDLHDGQFLWGGFNAAEGTDEAVTDLETVLGFAPDLGNTHTSGAAYLTFAGALGMIDPSTISADSDVNTIVNASVDSDATAVGNNMSVELAAFTPADALMIADITQYAYADVSASSLVDDVSVSSYIGFGDAGMGPGEEQIPLVSSSATAVGNNLNIEVSSPAL